LHIAFDLKDREIPRVLTYGMVLIGFILNFLIFTDDLLLKFLSIVVCLIFGYGLYKFGVWAGGDFKLFAGISFLLPIYSGLLFFPLIIILFALLVFFPFALIYMIYLMCTNKSLHKKALKEFYNNRFNLLFTANFLFLIYWINIEWFLALAVFIFLEYFKKYTKYLGFLVIVAVALQPDLIIVYLTTLFISVIYKLGIKSFNLLRKHVLLKTIQTKNLKEGMISAEDFWIENGKLNRKKPKLFDPFKKVKINSRLARGLTISEIKFLKKYKVKQVKVKKSMPFIPVILLGFIALLVYLKFL